MDAAPWIQLATIVLLVLLVIGRLLARDDAGGSLDGLWAVAEPESVNQPVRLNIVAARWSRLFH